MKQIRIKAFYLLFIYNFFFKHFVNGACPPKFTGEDLSYCLDSVDECKTKGLYYYNSFALQCWKTECPDGYYMNEKNSLNLPSEDISKNTCVKQCGQNFPKTRGTEKVCYKNCKTDEAYTIDEPNKCQLLSSITSSYPYVSEKDSNLYIKECHYEKFFLKRDGKTICISNCKEYDEYFVTGDQNCISKCNSTYPYVNIYNHCLKICTENNVTSHIYSKRTSSIPYSCIRLNDIDSGECYYESNLIIYDRNAQTFFNKNNAKICYPDCKDYVEKFETNKYYCVSTCTTYKKIIKIGSKNYTQCRTSCESNDLIINGQKECVSQCPQNYIKYDNVCYNAYCTNSQKFDEGQKKCTTNTININMIVL